MRCTRRDLGRLALGPPPEARARRSLACPGGETRLAVGRCAEVKTFAAQLTGWRASVDLSPLGGFRRQYEDAGVHIEIVKWDDLARMTDEELDYAFRVSKALGARALSTEIREVLQAMRDNRWPFEATVEFEYRVPDGSDRMTELARALAYCRECLLG